MRLLNLSNNYKRKLHCLNFAYTEPDFEARRYQISFLLNNYRLEGPDTKQYWKTQGFIE